MVNRAQAFLADWNEHCKIGAVPGTNGVDRQAATLADGEQRRWLAAMLEANGFQVHRDAIGNQFGLLERVPGAPYILVGSHLDSQPTAGRFDGAYGVVAGAHACIEAVKQIANDGVDENFNIALVNWFNEEGSRFKPSMMGSAVFTKKLDLEEALNTEDVKGITVKEAMSRINELGNFPGIDVAYYVEMHIQQGRSMEEDGVTIGLVNATWAAHKCEFKITGEQAHSGATLMNDRRDALLAASRLIVAAREIVDEFGEKELHSACGEINVYPNSPVVVASEAKLMIDLRSPSVEVVEKAHRLLMESVAEIERKDRVSITKLNEQSWGQKPYTPEGIVLAKEVADELNLSNDKVLTVAGHDSTNMTDIYPTIMLFIPSVEGISHNLNEFTSEADMLAGLEHLTGVIVRLAKNKNS